jgi:lambda repressor-like predicted transcriptional regulator
MEREKRYPTEGFHLGQIVKAELTRQGRSITWLAQQVGCSRENLYKVFRHKWIYTDLLFQISEALDYDFFKLCSDYYQAKKRERNGQSVDSNFPKDWDE